MQSFSKVLLTLKDVEREQSIAELIIHKTAINMFTIKYTKMSNYLLVLAI